MNSATTAVSVQDKLGPVSVSTYTKPDPYWGTQQCLVIGAALAGDNRPVVVFGYADGISTVYISATGQVRPYDDTSLDTLQTFFLGESCAAPEYDAQVYASQGQADYARRVLSLLIPHIPDIPGVHPQPSIEFIVRRLAARAERHVWCVRDEQDGAILHAYVDEYSDSELWTVVDDFNGKAYERFLDTLDVDEDEDFEPFEPPGEQRLKVHRVPESDIPAHIEIVGCNWPRDLIGEGER